MISNSSIYYISASRLFFLGDAFFLLFIDKASERCFEAL